MDRCPGRTPTSASSRGNHDIGENPPGPNVPAAEPLQLSRLHDYRAAFGLAYWTMRADGWHLIGLNAQLPGTSGSAGASPPARPTARPGCRAPRTNAAAAGRPRGAERRDSLDTILAPFYSIGHGRFSEAVKQLIVAYTFVALVSGRDLPFLDLYDALALLGQPIADHRPGLWLALLPRAHGAGRHYQIG